MLRSVGSVVPFPRYLLSLAPFVRSQGCLPSGAGRWGFGVLRGCSDDPVFFSPPLPWFNARAWASSAAAAAGVPSGSVMGLLGVLPASASGPVVSVRLSR